VYRIQIRIMYVKNYIKNMNYIGWFYLHPMSITRMAIIFSLAVFGATLPNPTLVRVVNIKYMLVTYRD
jgi:hypothetical protein